MVHLCRRVQAAFSLGLSSRKKKRPLLVVFFLAVVCFCVLVLQWAPSIAARSKGSAQNLVSDSWSPLRARNAETPGLRTSPKKSLVVSALPIGLAGLRYPNEAGQQQHTGDIIKQEIKQATIKNTENFSTPSATNVQSGDQQCLEWVHLVTKPPFYLTVVLLIRIYEKDKAKLTTAEMKMWLMYLKYAGVEHVYIYDAFVYPSESQFPHLKKFLDEGYVTYVDWHTRNPYSISGTQVTAYQHCVDNYKQDCNWQAAIDIDEYPFSPKDQEPGFLFRYMKNYEKTHPRVSELSMQNFLFLGKPLEKELMIERLMRRTPNRSNVLSKPIYKPSNLRSVSIHHNSVAKGTTDNAPVGELRMNHYWGARLQNWGEDTEEILKITMPDSSMKPIIKAFKTCETHVRQYLK